MDNYKSLWKPSNLVTNNSDGTESKRKGFCYKDFLLEKDKQTFSLYHAGTRTHLASYPDFSFEAVTYKVFELLNLSVCWFKRDKDYFLNLDPKIRDQIRNILFEIRSV